MEFTLWNKHLGLVTVKLSDEDADLAAACRWHLSGGKVRPGEPGRYVRNGDGQYLHHVVADRMGIVVDHIKARWLTSVDHANGDRFDNRRENLRLGTRKQQMSNPKDSLRRTNTSGHRGVSFCATQRSDKQWYAYAQVDGRSRSLGYYATKEDAVAARTAWESSQE